MAKTIISCDTTCAIYGQEREELGIYVLPLNVIIDNQEFHDGIDIDINSLCSKMRSKADIKTSTPTPFEIESFFDKIFAETNADKIIHFTISSKLSSMFSLFQQICAEKYGDKVIIFDSKSVCSFMGNLVRYAVKLNKEGKSPEEIVDGVTNRMGNDDIIFIPESLEFLKRGGRVSPAVATIANILGIKPVLRFTEEEGIVKEGTTRTIKKAYISALEKYASRKDIDKFEIHILDGDASAICKEAKKFAKEILPKTVVKITPLSINVCAHTGPGTFGIGLTLKV